MITGRWLEVGVIDRNIGIDTEIGFGILDMDMIILNRLAHTQVKCHITHNMKAAGWVKAVVGFREEFKGKLLVKPKSATLRRKVGFGTMNCVVRVTVGEDVSSSKMAPNTK